MSHRKAKALVFVVQEDVREGITDSISARNQFTAFLPRKTFSPVGSDIGIVIFDRSTIGGAALVRQSGYGASGTIRAKFTDFVDLAIPWSELSAKLSLNERSVLTKLVLEGGRPAEATWQRIWDGIKLLAGPARPELEALQSQIGLYHFDPADNEDQILYFERDAAGLCLDFTGLDRRVLLQKATPARASAPKAALELLSNVDIEDHYIAHDASKLPGFLTKNEGIGGVTLSDGVNEVTIVNVNRTKRETAAGADLIYLNQTCGSWVLVQYKMMERVYDIDDPEWVYRATGGKYQTSLDRMRAAQGILGKQADTGSLRDFRLSDEPCFFKLCPHDLSGIDRGALAPGMYVSLAHWDRLVADPRTIGPGNGRVVGFRYSDRYLTNSDFTSLVRNGWIGSRGPAEHELRKVLDELLAAEHSVTIGVGNAIPVAEDRSLRKHRR